MGMRDKDMKIKIKASHITLDFRTNKHNINKKNDIRSIIDSEFE
jgi:hypothetical protein